MSRSRGGRCRHAGSAQRRVHDATGTGRDVEGHPRGSRRLAGHARRRTTTGTGTAATGNRPPVPRRQHANCGRSGGARHAAAGVTSIANGRCRWRRAASNPLASAAGPRCLHRGQRWRRRHHGRAARGLRRGRGRGGHVTSGSGGATGSRRGWRSTTITGTGTHASRGHWLVVVPCRAATDNDHATNARVAARWWRRGAAGTDAAPARSCSCCC